MNISFCMIASIIIYQSVYFMFFKKQANLEPLLNEKQLELYNAIHKERATLYRNGTILGVIIALLILHNSTMTGKFCVFAVIVHSVSYLYYTLSDKQFILPHLEGDEQINEWLNVYKTMKHNYHFGFLAGFIAYTLFDFLPGHLTN